MKTKHVTTRIPVNIFEQLQRYTTKNNVTMSAGLSELICEHFRLEYTPEEFATFTKVSKSLLMLSSKAQKQNAFYAEIGKELVENLTRDADGGYRRTKNGMYYFSDTEKMRELITDYLEDEAEYAEERKAL